MITKRSAIGSLANRTALINIIKNINRVHRVRPRVVNLPYITPNKVDETRLIFDTGKSKKIKIIVTRDVLNFSKSVLSGVKEPQLPCRLTSLSGLGKTISAYFTGKNSNKQINSFLAHFF